MASRANHRVLLGCALVCAAALLCFEPAVPGAAEGDSSNPVAVSGFPVASDVRLAGDGKQTRFILDLDKKIAFRAFPLADPYRVVIDIPQVSFQLPAGAGATGRGLIKAFRYGLVMPGGSRIVFDLTGPAKIANCYVLEAANGQPPRLVLELEEVDRTAFVQSLGTEDRPELKPAIADAPAAVEPAAIPKPAAAAPADLRPVVVIDPGHGGIDTGTKGPAWENARRISWCSDFAMAAARADRADRQIPRADDAFGRHFRATGRSRSDRAHPVPARPCSSRSTPIRLAAASEGDAQGATDLYAVGNSKRLGLRGGTSGRRRKQAPTLSPVLISSLSRQDVVGILIDLAQRETKTFSNAVRTHKLDRPDEGCGARLHKESDQVSRFQACSRRPTCRRCWSNSATCRTSSDLAHRWLSDNWRSTIPPTPMASGDRRSIFSKRHVAGRAAPIDD